MPPEERESGVPDGGDDRREGSSMASALRKAGPYLNIGWSFVIPMLIGLGAGWYLDGRFGWDPWAKLVGLLLGMAVGFLSFFVVVLRLPRGQAGGGDDRRRNGR